MDIFEPEYKVTPHKKIIPRINAIYREVNLTILEELYDVMDVAITTDAWTSLAIGKYVTVTIHYIKKDLQWKSTPLCASELDKSRSTENIAIKLELVQAECNPEGKIRVYLQESSSRRKVAGGLKRPACFGHKLQLAVNSGFAIEEVNSLIKKCGKLMGFSKSHF